MLLRALLSLPLLKKTMNRKPNSSNLWRFLLRLDCTGKQISELLKLITLNFMPIYHEMTGLKCLEIRQRSAHVHSHKDQPVRRRFFLKAIVPNLLFQNLWHVHGASQSFPQSKPPTSLCSWKQKGGCGLVKPSKQPV